MSLHTIPAGVTLIEGLIRLGGALGYVATREHPVEQRSGSAPAVDVAWLIEKAHRFPLMIFEVESKATSSAANNPVKVYGQSSDLFEKPLFFFHVFLASGPTSTRAQNLLNLFGSHNYRVYRLDQDGVEPLFRDILAQHRRLQRVLDLGQVLSVADTPPWQDIAPEVVAKTVEQVDFHSAFLASYAFKARSDRRYRAEHLRLLRSSESPYGPDDQAKRYEGFIGQAWSAPVHLGLLGLADCDVLWLNRLRDWQERWSYMSMVGPHFGLSRDYDEFVLGQAPVLWALTAALLYKIPNAGTYVGSQLATVLEKVGAAMPRVSFFTAVWAVHLASAVGDEALYSLARDFINERGGIPSDGLFEPPSAVSVLERDETWTQALAEDRLPVPDIQEFRRKLPPHYSRVADIDEELFDLAYSLLTSNEPLLDWSGRVALLLHTSYGHLPVKSVAV